MRLFLVILTLLAQNTNNYLAPKQLLHKNPNPPIRVQVIVHDSLEAAGVQIVNAQFNGQFIPLKPRDIYGYRGQGSFQVEPGKYKLRWKVQRDRFIWPRTSTHEEEVTIDARDMWIQISIVGEEASIE